MSNDVKKTGGWRTNKWIRAAIPALLLHCSTGTVYCWSLFSDQIGQHIGFSKVQQSGHSALQYSSLVCQQHS